jgi:hypothetical protein
MDDLASTTLQTIAIRAAGDVSDALVLSLRQGGLIVAEANLCPEFFDLRTGFAGDLLQRFVNYRARLAILVADPRAHGERFTELVYEHRAHPAVRFFGSEADARRWLER